jgi:surface carbohydrate biosynthesis protein
MFKEVDIIFFVEHKDREFESVKLIAEKLKGKGKSSLILSVYFHVHYLNLYKAKTFVFPYLINQNDWPVSFVYRMYGDSAEYINMNWEQLLFPVNIEYKKPQDNFVKQKVKHIAWNNNFKDYLIKNGVSDENIKVTGNPANEVLYNLLDKKDEWRLKLVNEFSLDINKKWLFMPMNYAWAFSSDRLIQSKINKGYPEDKAWKHKKYSHKCLKKFIYFIEKLSKEYDYEIIIRPHPSITENDYKKVFDETIGYIPKNIYLNKAHSIREWIVSSDIVGSSWSTSVWDAYNVGKSVFLFTPYKRPEWLDVWWNNEVVNLNDYNEEKVLSKIGILQTEQSSKKIASFCLDNLISKPSIKKYLFDVKTNAKVIRSFLLNQNMINARALEYDRFESIISEK